MILLVLVFLIGAGQSLASSTIQLSSSISSADVLPKSVWGVFYASSFFSSRFEYKDRDRSNLGAKISSELKYSDVIDLEDTVLDKAVTRAGLSELGVTNFEDLAGSLKGDLSFTSQVQVPVLMYGFTDRLTLGALVPYFTVEVDYESSFQESSSFNKVMRELEKLGDYKSIDKANEEIKKAIPNELREQGYLSLGPKRYYLGNPSVFYRYNITKKEKVSLTFGQTLTIPQTYRNQPSNDLVNLGINDEQYDLDNQIFGDLNFSNWGMSNSLSFRYQFSGEKQYRIRERDGSLVSRSAVLGNQYGAVTSFSSGFWLNPIKNHKIFSSFFYTHKEKDKFKGGSLTEAEKDLLESGSNQDLGAISFGYNLNTIDYFLKKQFILPMDITISYSKTLWGKNVLDTDVLSMQVGFFYK